MKRMVKLLFILSVGWVIVSCHSVSKMTENEVRGAIIQFKEHGMEMEVMDIEVLPDGSMMGATGSGNEIMNVYFNESTVFEIHEISGSAGEETVKVRVVTVQDIVVPATVTVFGEYQGTQFVAELLQIWINVH